MKIDIKKIFTPKLFTGLAVVGVGVTVFLAVKETRKVVQEESVPEAIAEVVDDVKDIKPSLNKIADVAWHYKGTIISSAATILCIMASHKLSTKEIAALTATCGYLAANRDALEKEIVKLPGGKEALERVRKEIAEKGAQKALDNEEKEPKSKWKYQSVEDTGNGNLLCYDCWSGRYFRSSLDAVEQAQARFNDMRDSDGFSIQERNGDISEYPAALSVNELFDEYGLERTQLGLQYGWPADDEEYYTHRRIEFVNTLIALDKLDPATRTRYNEDLLVIEYGEGSYPMECWMEI